jgi:hypothetical protein
MPPQPQQSDLHAHRNLWQVICTGVLSDSSHRFLEQLLAAAALDLGGEDPDLGLLGLTAIFAALRDEQVCVCVHLRGRDHCARAAHALPLWEPRIPSTPLSPCPPTHHVHRCCKPLHSFPQLTSPLCGLNQVLPAFRNPALSTLLKTGLAHEAPVVRQSFAEVLGRCVYNNNNNIINRRASLDWIATETCISTFSHFRGGIRVLTPRSPLFFRALPRLLAAFDAPHAASGTFPSIVDALVSHMASPQRKTPPNTNTHHTAPHPSPPPPPPSNTSARG